jgi:ornithine carbamoyltransferase
VARVLGRYADAIAARVLKHDTVVELAKYSGVPVINALSDLFHPTQAIADVMTIIEKLGKIEGVKVVFVGDGRDNVAHSLILAATSLGAHVRVVTAPGYEPLDQVIASAEERARRSGGSFEIIYDPCEGVKGADVIYTDVWVSMGFENERERRIKVLSPYQVNEKLLECVGKDFIFMHCLPARRGEEVTEEVLEAPYSVVWDQAENKLHAQRAILALLVP